MKTTSSVPLAARDLPNKNPVISWFIFLKNPRPTIQLRYRTHKSQLWAFVVKDKWPDCYWDSPMAPWRQKNFYDEFLMDWCCRKKSVIFSSWNEDEYIYIYNYIYMMEDTKWWWKYYMMRNVMKIYDEYLAILRLWPFWNSDSCDPFKGESWPPTFGDQKVMAWITLDEGNFPNNPNIQP